MFLGHRGDGSAFVVSRPNPAFRRRGVTQALCVDPHCLYLDGRGRMDGVRVLLRGGASTQESEVPQGAQQRDGKRSQMEGDGAAGRML